MAFIEFDPPFPPRGCLIVFLFVWTCGMALASLLCIATLLGLPVHWAGGETPPTWSLIILAVAGAAATRYGIHRLITVWRSRDVS